MNIYLYKSQQDIIGIKLYIELMKSIKWRDRDENEFKDACDRSLMVAYAFEGSKLIGAGRVVGDKFSATLFDLVVHPDHQRQGVGAAIVKCLAEQLHDMGIDTLYCFADNEASAEYYRHRGWSELNGFRLELN
jgi:N-acetylglutamate synthase-like GNAT family acetyltransferase